MIGDLIEKINFRTSFVPCMQHAFLHREGELITYDMSTAGIGTRPWKEGYGYRDYQEGVDPPFLPQLPWAKEEASSQNVIQDESGTKIVLPKKVEDKKGVLWSNWTMKYGTVQICAKLPNVRGAWSAIWLFDGMPELDIVEHCGQESHEFNVTHHWGCDYGGEYGKKSTLHNDRWNRNVKPSEDFYVWEVEVTPYKVIYRVNGVVTRTVKKGIPSHEQHLILSIDRGSYCGSDPEEDLEDDAVMEVKWVKVYKTT